MQCVSTYKWGAFESISHNWTPDIFWLNAHGSATSKLFVNLYYHQVLNEGKINRSQQKHQYYFFPIFEITQQTFQFNFFQTRLISFN